MAFSFGISDPTGNTTSTASPTLVVSPTSAIITQSNMTPGQTATGTVNVSNTSGVDEFYQVSVNWSPTGSTTQGAATRLTNELVVSVTAGSPTATASPVFAGTMVQLLDQPASPGQTLPLTVGNENVQFQVILPSAAGPAFQGIDVGFDIQFVGLT